MTDVLDGTIDPGRVFDYETDLDHIGDAYRAMDERRAIKSLIRGSAAAKLLIGSKMDSRPPGRSTRKNSANAACLRST
jgi:hypothetical protein